MRGLHSLSRALEPFFAVVLILTDIYFLKKRLYNPSNTRP